MPAVARLSLRVVPGGSRDAVEGEMADGTIKVRLRARAVEGAANEALIEFVARVLGVPRRAIDDEGSASSTGRPSGTRSYATGWPNRFNESGLDTRHTRATAGSAIRAPSDSLANRVAARVNAISSWCASPFRHRP